MQPRRQQREAGALRRRPSPPSAATAAVTAAAVLCCSLARAGRAVAFSTVNPAVVPARQGSTCSGSRSSAAVSMSRGFAGAYGHRPTRSGGGGSGGGSSTATWLDGSRASCALDSRQRLGQGFIMRRRGGKRSGGVGMMMSSGAADGADEEDEDEEAEAARAEREFESIFDKNSAILDVPLETFDESRVEPLMPGSVRTEMPVFMLDVSACPGGVVPLHIFEMRYRQMFNDIGTKDNRFGMLVSDPTTGRPCKYGAVMECAQRKLLPDGRQYVLNQAVERFRVLKVLKSAPYTIMEVEVGIPDNKPLEGEPSKWGADEGTRLEDLELEVYATVNSVVELMNKLAPPATPGENRTLSEWFLRYSPKVKRDEGLEGESAGDDLAKQAKEDERRMNFSFAVAEMIAMESHTKQLLLQSRSTAYRLMAVREILVKAQKELAAKSSLKDTLG